MWGIGEKLLFGVLAIAEVALLIVRIRHLPIPTLRHLLVLPVNGGIVRQTHVPAVPILIRLIRRLNLLIHRIRQRNILHRRLNRLRLRQHLACIIRTWLPTVSSWAEPGVDQSAGPMDCLPDFMNTISQMS